ncbi:MAG: tetratricopeptide repeat protein [Candidatus Omnitrophica bacterium]|nr:tetratricopeptide repeat protein [Candidatus Omnitrophota bacterium]MCM8791236.1 tetratricopeptide repeat protein [Candidatus Omnitrophota bacterium]
MKILIVILILIITSFGTTFVYHSTHQAEINYYKGHRYFEKAHYTKAIPYFKKAIAIDPRRLDALRELGYSCQWTGRHSEAIEAFEKLLALRPDDLTVKGSLAETYSWEKKYTEAIRLYEEILRKGRDTATDRRLAEVFMWTGQWERAERLLIMVLKENPTDIKTRFLMAQALQYSGRAADAVMIYRTLLEDEKVNKDIKMKTEIRRLLGEAYMISKDYGDSIAEYRRILKKDPNNVKVLLSLADILSWQKQYDESIAGYRKALEIEPGSIDIKWKLANVLVWSKDLEGSERLLREIISQDSQYVEAYGLLGQILTWQKKYAQAIGYLEKALSIRDDGMIRAYYAKALLYSGDYVKAEKTLKEILAKDPDDLKAKVYLADLYSYTKRFQQSIAFYEEVLKKSYDREVKRKLADVLSWARDYRRSIKAYDDLLAETEDSKIRLQKARVLGWMREYDRSLKEYQKILEMKYDRDIEVEMKAKTAYWGDRVEQAIKYYKEAIRRASGNVEAMFDLSQIYSYQSMWKEATDEYKKILEQSPTHFRANEGLEKISLMAAHLRWDTGYDFVEADSISRDMDVRKHSYFNKFSYPLDYTLRIDAGQKLTFRSFSDYSQVIENEEMVKLTYMHNPIGWVDGFYNCVIYNKDIKAMNTFGSSATFRVLGTGAFRFSYERERLENSSSVIVSHEYRDCFRERLDLSLSKRLKVGADMLYATYSDHNYLNEPGFDILYFFSLDPLRFSVKYRYFYKEFNEKVAAYWSPKGFTTNSVFFNWRHYLNKEEIFFGADDLYYDIGYQFSVDSETVVAHKFSGEFNWDINKRLNFNVRSSFSRSSNKVYKDSDLIASFKYYF